MKSSCAGFLRCKLLDIKTHVYDVQPGSFIRKEENKVVDAETCLCFSSSGPTTRIDIEVDRKSVVALCPPLRLLPRRRFVCTAIQLLPISLIRESLSSGALNRSQALRERIAASILSLFPHHDVFNALCDLWDEIHAKMTDSQRSDFQFVRNSFLSFAERFAVIAKLTNDPRVAVAVYKGDPIDFSKVAPKPLIL